MFLDYQPPSNLIVTPTSNMLVSKPTIAKGVNPATALIDHSATLLKDTASLNDTLDGCHTQGLKLLD